MKNTVPESQSERVKATLEILKSRLAQDDFPNNKQLLEICGDYGIQLLDSEGGPHLIHEILETALNLYLREAHWIKARNFKSRDEILARLEDLTKRLPPQSWRDSEQIKFQQFSTPPALAFVLAQLLRLKAGKSVLEPSAGTGSLAVWLKKADCLTKVNEFSARRRMLLELQNFKPFAVNAEFLDDLLPAQVKPDFILMNPPFSANGGLSRDSNFGFQHTQAALLRLNPGGRLVALLGAKACLHTDKGKKFWHRLRKEYCVSAFLIIPPEVYYKYGTTFQTVAVVISKPEISHQPTPFKPQIREFKSLREAARFIDDSDIDNL